MFFSLFRRCLHIAGEQAHIQFLIGGIHAKERAAGQEDCTGNKCPRRHKQEIRYPDTLHRRRIGTNPFRIHAALPPMVRHTKPQYRIREKKHGQDNHRKE